MISSRLMTAVAAAATAAALAACAPLPSQHRYVSSDLKRHGCERVAQTGSRIKNRLRCNWDRHPDSHRRRDELSGRTVFTHPRERPVRPSGF